MDLRRPAIVFEEPQLAVSRQAFPRRSSGDRGGRQYQMDERLGYGQGRVINGRGRAAKIGLAGIAFLLFLLMIGARWAASLLIEYSWWQEVGQVRTWIDLYAYGT